MFLNFRYFFDQSRIQQMIFHLFKLQNKERESLKFKTNEIRYRKLKNKEREKKTKTKNKWRNDNRNSYCYI